MLVRVWSSPLRSACDRRATAGAEAPEGRGRGRGGGSVRWDELFRDLEAQLGPPAPPSSTPRSPTRTRREAARPLRSSTGRAPRWVSGRRAGPGRGAVEGGCVTWAPSGCCSTKTVGLTPCCRSPRCCRCPGSRWTGVPGSGGEVFARLGLASALRGIARDRAPVLPRPSFRRQRGHRHAGPGGRGLPRAQRARAGGAAPSRRRDRGADRAVRGAGAGPQRALTRSCGGSFVLLGGPRPCSGTPSSSGVVGRTGAGDELAGLVVHPRDVASRARWPPPATGHGHRS